MAGKNSCVSIYPDSLSLQQALTKLQRADCDLCQVSVMGKDCHGEEQPVGFYCTGKHIHFCGPRRVFWEGLWGLLKGAAYLWVPGIGPLVVAGRIVTLMAYDQQDTEIDGGFTVLGAALYGIGVPRYSIDEYETALKAEFYLLLVHGLRCDIERACDVLHCEAQQVTVHSA